MVSATEYSDTEWKRVNIDTNVEIGRVGYRPTWAKLIDFETTPPSLVEELARQLDGGGSVGLTLQHKNRDVLVEGPEIEIVRVRTRHLTPGGSR